jgi:hypothetical protein
VDVYATPMIKASAVAVLGGGNKCVKIVVIWGVSIGLRI